MTYQVTIKRSTANGIETRVNVTADQILAHEESSQSLEKASEPHETTNPNSTTADPQDMTERKSAEAVEARLSAFPEKTRALLRLVEHQRGTEVGQVLTNFAASAIHPDFVCNVNVFARTTQDVRSAALEFFEQTLFPGFTHDEAGALEVWLTPYLMGNAGPAGPGNNLG